MHPDLLEAQKLAYEPSGLKLQNFQKEAESQEYGACTFELNDRRIGYRIAKITPIKVGQFVTLWKRNGSGPIMPYDMADPIDLFIISVRSFDYFGQFVFPKELLIKKGIVSKEGKGGKRAMRVYPPWDIPTSRQAKNTQAWLQMHFLEIDPKKSVDTAWALKFFIPN